jgi:hypothetical protein
LLTKLSVPKDGRLRMIRGRRLFWIFGLAGVSGRVAIAAVVEAEVGDKVFAHDVGAGDEDPSKA